MSEIKQNIINELSEEELENVASIDQNPKLEGKFMTMILAPKK